jgi:hypothetical protein
MHSPGIDGASGIFQAREPVLIQTTVAELAVEAFDERVLGRFARLNEVQCHAGALRPQEHRLAGELGAVITDQRRGQSSERCDPESWKLLCII